MITGHSEQEIVGVKAHMAAYCQALATARRSLERNVSKWMVRRGNRGLTKSNSRHSIGAICMNDRHH